jgi:hypothetical protein
VLGRLLSPPKLTTKIIFAIKAALIFNEASAVNNSTVCKSNYDERDFCKAFNFYSHDLSLCVILLDSEINIGALTHFHCFYFSQVFNEIDESFEIWAVDKILEFRGVISLILYFARGKVQIKSYPKMVFSIYMIMCDNAHNHHF